MTLNTHYLFICELAEAASLKSANSKNYYFLDVDSIFTSCKFN